MREIPLKHLARINARTLPDDTDPAFDLRYLDIGAVGRGALLAEPEPMTFAVAPSRARRRVSPGDTLISTVRTYLRAVWPVVGPTEDLVVSTGFAVLSPGPQLEPRYLGWVAQSDPFVEAIVARSVGVSYPAINPLEIGDISVSVPDGERQRLIADFLDAETARIDALIAKKRRLADVAESRLRVHISKLTKAAVVVGLNGGGARPPEGWRAMRLRRCLSAIDYGIGEASEPAGAVAVLAMGNVDDCGRIVGECGGYVESKSVNPKLFVRSGDLLFNRTNSLAKVGKIGLVRDLVGPTTFASYLVRLRTTSIADAAFLNYLLNTDEILGLVRSSALPSIGQANLKPSRYSELQIALPVPDVQRGIVAELDAERGQVDSLTGRLQRQLVLLRERRQALITAAVTGDLDIPGAAA